MTQRRRRADVERTPEREVRPGISAATWWPDRYRIIDDPLPRPPAQDAALFRREDIDAAVARGVGLTPMDRQALLMGTFPDQPRAEIPNPRVLREMLRAEYEGSWPRPRDLSGLPRDVIAFRGKLYDRDAVDRAMAQDRAEREARMFPPTPWQSAPDAWVRRAEAERRAVERTGRALVAWLIGRWRR